MAVLKIARLGNPVLRQIAEPVDPAQLTAPGEENELQQFIDDLVDTMRQEGGVGIAAPQVDRSLQIVAVEYESNERYPDGDEIPLAVLVNPVITWQSEGTSTFWEGCLSLKEFRGLVRWPREVRVEAYTRNGEKISIEAKGFMAVVIQHEIDHLHGKVFLDRMEDMTQLSYNEEFFQYWVESEAAAPASGSL